MTIGTGDIKLLKPQVLLDTSDGGGAMTSNEVVDGLSNNLFADISELDRTYGRVSLRKAFAAINTTNVDSYFGSHAIVSKIPEDPRVSVSLFSTRDWFDRRDNARDKIERYLARGPKWAGHLLETQLDGQRAIQLALRLNDDEPKVGQGLSLVEDEGKSTEYEQFVRVTKTTSVERTFTVQGKDIVRKICTVEISDPLRYTFHGPTVSEYELGSTIKAVCRDTRVANAATYYGASKLTDPGSINDASILVDNIFTQLVPSAQSETPLVDLNAASLSNLYVPGNDNLVSTTISGTMGPNTNLYIGSPIIPSSLALTYSGNTITDAGGILRFGSTQIGTIEYDKGLLKFNASASSFTGTMGLVFKPAAVPSRIQDTASISIVQNSRGYNYTITLQPIPQLGSLVVSYVSQGKAYFLFEQGDGSIKGSDAAFGAGSISFITGSVIITTGALPDANSEIIFAWGKKSTTFTRANITPPPTSVLINLSHEQVTPSSVTIEWTVNAVDKTATDNGVGLITGDASGTINYASGEIKLIPTALYQAGTEFTVDYQWGPANEQRFDMPTRGVDGTISIILPDIGGSIIPKSVELKWNVDILDSESLGDIFTTQEFDPVPQPFRRDPLVQSFDDGAGLIKRSDGTLQPDSSINYTTRELELNPEFEVSIPKPVFGNKQIGQVKKDVIVNGASAQETITSYRYQLLSWDYVPTLATMPYDETGYIIVKWRTTAASTAASEVFQADELRFDLTPGFTEDILQGSVRFTLGGKVYIDRLGSLYHSIDPATGAGILAGSIAYQTGAILIEDWLPGTTNTMTIQSLVTEMNIQPVDEVVFRIPIAPVRVGSVQIRAVPIEGNSGGQVIVSADSNGKIASPYMIGQVDYESGVVRIKFGQKVTVDSGVMLEPWYDAGAVFIESSVNKIIKPRPVYADSIRYNAVGYTYLPLSSDILGLDPVRLPSDGRVPIFRTGDVCVIHHTEKTVFPGTPTTGTTLDVGRVRIAYAKVMDSLGALLNPNMYTVDLDAGIVTLGGTYVLGSLTLPLYAEHRVEDMALVTDVQINGRLALNRPLTHNYPDGEAYASSALIFGDLQSRAFQKFSQESWTNVWADAIIGNPTTAQYNDTLNPIVTNNRGATEEKWALIFTNSTSFRVVGKSVGQIATGDINTTLSPNNPATGQPYFTLAASGWGTGWAAGNVLRFNTAAANYPIWLARTVLQGPATELNDGFQLQIRGDIDR